MPTKKAATVKAVPSKKKATKGDSYVCEVCGFSLIVDEDCDCAEAHEIICCGKSMSTRKTKVKTAK